MKVRLSRRMSTSLVAVFTAAAGSVTWMAMGASAAPRDAPHGGTVLHTNLVSDLAGTAAVTDPNLVAVYFTAGLSGESHGLFGSLTTAAPGSPEGPAEAQWVQANADAVQLDLAQLSHDISSGAPPATIDQDTDTLKADTAQLVDVERDFSADLRADAA